MVHSLRSLLKGRETPLLWEVDLVRRLISQSPVGSLPIVEVKIPRQSVSSVFNFSVFREINLFVFNRSPQPLHKDLIVHPASSIHTDPDSPCRQRIQEFRAGKLHALV